ncbi:hypothetical protein [uncultured Rhodoblastus sp.]|uniref:hypothetical protein n=1 Tax=uncultured Rhodoblastus sp. TaxID=543037 RepID=UPI0025FF9F07|nr:hypothetical protein [uncultured Rhodoblastus sp.]
MIGDRNKGIWARLASGIDRRLRRRLREDEAGDDAFCETSDAAMALDRDDDGPYVADVDGGAKQRIEFSQHLSS